MIDAISALPSPTLPIRHEFDHDGAPETKSLAFNEIWQYKEKGLTFGDVLDIINPLQHIPIVSTIYRMVTGNEIGMGARLAAGPLGIVAAGVEEASGGAVEQNIASLFGGDEPAARAAAVTTAATAPDRPVPQRAAAAPPQIDVPTLTTAQTAFLANLAPAAGQPASGQPAAAIPVPARTAAATEQPARTDRAGETASARVAREIAAAQRARAGLLLAGLQAESAAKQLTASGKETDREAESAAIATPPTASQNSVMRFRSHP